MFKFTHSRMVKRTYGWMYGYNNGSDFIGPFGKAGDPKNTTTISQMANKANNVVH